MFWGLLFFTDTSIHTEQVRMLRFQGRSCYLQNIRLSLLLLYPENSGVVPGYDKNCAHTDRMRLGGCAFYLVNNLDTRPTDHRYARQISSQNACFWVSFSSPTRVYTQNRLGCSLFRAGVATGRKFCYSFSILYLELHTYTHLSLIHI